MGPECQSQDIKPAGPSFCKPGKPLRTGRDDRATTQYQNRAVPFAVGSQAVLWGAAIDHVDALPQRGNMTFLMSWLMQCGPLYVVESLSVGWWHVSTCAVFHEQEVKRPGCSRVITLWVVDMFSGAVKAEV
jgi:hypothetical protein